MPSFIANDPETSHPIASPLPPHRRSHEKDGFAAGVVMDLPDGYDGQIINGIRYAQAPAPETSLTDQTPNGTLNGRPSGGSSTYSRDKLRSRDGSVASGGQDGQESGRRSPRPSSASTKLAAGPNGYHAALSNGWPLLPTPLRTGPDEGPAQGSLASQSRMDFTPSTSLTDRTGVPATTHHTVHRFSSPPVFRTPSPTLGAGSTPSSMQSAPPPLRHRHTLQVPKPPSARTSRDISTLHPNPSEEMASASGRYSLTNSGTRRASLTLGRRTTRSVHSDLHPDEIPQDEDAARWTEAIRQRRTSRRKRKEEEDDDRVVMGTKVDQNHVNWVTAYNMLTGIRFTVSRTNAKLDRPLTDADFEARHKFSFDITGNELTPSAKYDFKFKDYAPWVFRHLRARFKLDPADYLMSLTSKYILSELGSPGKSGSFFYFSRDYKYIIKTIHHGEHKLLRKILRDYYQHVLDNPDTLLSQFYGLHRVKIPYGKKIHFVVMNNLFPPHRDIHQTFDLKGSTIGRDFKEEDLAKNPRATLKDLNWLRRDLHLEFGPTKRNIFLAQVQRDVKLLQALKIMDYSLLVGVHDLERGNDENLRDKTLRVFQPGGEQGEEAESSVIARTPSKMETARKARELRQIIKRERPIPMDQSTSKMPDEMQEERKDFIFYGDDGGFRATHENDRPGEVIYYLGIIDCLTHYGTIKKAEHFWKGLSHPKSQISPIAPESYGDRFIKFITGITKSREEAAREKASKSPRDGLPEAPGLGDRIRRSSTDVVMEKAERQAQQTEKDGAVENDAYDRTLSAVRGPSAEISTGATGNTLPIVEEVGEAGSTSGRSQGESVQPNEKGGCWVEKNRTQDGAEDGRMSGVVHSDGVDGAAGAGGGGGGAGAGPTMKGSSLAFATMTSGGGLAAFPPLSSPSPSPSPPGAGPGTGAITTTPGASSSFLTPPPSLLPCTTTTTTASLR